MENIKDKEALQNLLTNMEIEFACVLAARCALRVVPILETALQEDQEERRCSIVLPSFRALAAVNLAAARPEYAKKVCKIARTTSKEIDSVINKIYSDSQISVIEYKELGIDEAYGEIWRLEDDIRALSDAGYVVSGLVEATQSIVAKVDLDKGISSADTVIDAAVKVVEHAQSAISGIHGDLVFNLDWEEKESKSESYPHIAEFWNALDLDVKWLANCNEEMQKNPKYIVAGLSEQALWLRGTPIWVSRQWADFKDK